MPHPSKDDWLSEELVERFWANVDRSGKCWQWIASVCGGGYGKIWEPRPNRRLWRASRLSWVIHNGEIPRGKCVLHRCDNRLCVNPKHLFLGTKSDNAKDAVAKGRWATRTGPNKSIQGEKHGRAKLSESQALEILRTNAPIKELAEQFGVGETQIYRIKTGRRWGHLHGQT